MPKSSVRGNHSVFGVGCDIEHIKLILLLVAISCVAVGVSMFNLVVYSKQNAELQEHVQQLDKTLQENGGAIVQQATELRELKSGKGMRK